MKKVLLTVTTITGLLLITGCGQVAKLENGEEKIVSFEGNDISVDSLYEKMKNDHALSVLLNMVDTKILTEKYPEDQDEVDYINGKMEEARLAYEYYYKDSYASFELFIPTYFGVSTESAAKELLSLSYKRNLAAEDYAKSLVTEKEINNYYEEETIGDLKVKHILIKADYDEATATAEEKEKAFSKALEEAKSVLAELKNGKDFDELAKEYSDDDANSEQGGELAWFNRGEMVEEFEEASIKLEKGKYTTEPVKTQYGYHIILKVDQKEKPTLESVKDSIIETLAEEKTAEDENLPTLALIQLREDNDMSIADSELNKQYKNYVSQFK